MQEIWKDIQGYEGLYQISNLGNVKSLKRYVQGRYKGKLRIQNERILKPNINTYGYNTVILCKDSKIKGKLIHRLVANAFVDNPCNLPQVNHINLIKTDNKSKNLEWCTPLQNTRHAIKNNHSAKRKPVIGVCKKNGLILTFISIRSTRHAGFNTGHVTNCVKGRLNQHKGYTWRYL